MVQWIAMLPHPFRFWDANLVEKHAVNFTGIPTAAPGVHSSKPTMTLR